MALEALATFHGPHRILQKSKDPLVVDGLFKGLCKRHGHMTNVSVNPLIWANITVYMQIYVHMLRF